VLARVLQMRFASIFNTLVQSCVRAREIVTTVRHLPVARAIILIALISNFRLTGPILKGVHFRLKTMMGSKTTIARLFLTIGISGGLGGCYLYDSANYVDWLEYRVKRDGHKVGELVAKVKRRGDKAKWPGDSYEILIRWPTKVAGLSIPLGPAERKKEADAFVRKLCGVNDDIYLIDESFNDRTGEVYLNFWCRPSKRL